MLTALAFHKILAFSSNHPVVKQQTLIDFASVNKKASFLVGMKPFFLPRIQPPWRVVYTAFSLR